MPSMRAIVILLILSTLITGRPSSAQTADAGELAKQAEQTEQANRQYRLARRLVAEGSSEAAAALDRVVAIDPVGPLSDDAQLERVLLLKIARWPHELGRLGPVAHLDAGKLLDRLIATPPPEGADRMREARYLRALLRLEPIAGFDADRARIDLLALTTVDRDDDWSFSARLVLGWIAEQRGELSLAEASYGRLRVDAAGHAATCHARLRLASMALRDDRAQDALLASDPTDLGCESPHQAGLFQLAYDRWRQRVATVEAVRASLSFRPVNVAAFDDRSWLVDRRGDRILELDLTGAEQQSWPLEDAVDVAVTGNGVLYGFSFNSVVRLERDGSVLPLVSLAEFGPVAAGTVDRLGRIYVLDRRGVRVGRIDPGGRSVELHWSGDRVRLSGLTWDGRRLLGADGRNGSIVTIERDGSSVSLIAGGLDRPIDVAADPSGRFAVVESRGETIRFFAADGSPLGRLTAEAGALSRTDRIAFSNDGTVRLIAEGDSGWWRSK
jgi:sugar lactone lactonase YvrE